MIRYFSIFLPVLIAGLINCGQALSSAKIQAKNQAKIREPAVAGRFYPDDPDVLRKEINNFFKNAGAPVVPKPIALVSPHAGYVFSGRICASALNQASPFKYGLIVILGTNHTLAGFDKISVYPFGGYKTPLGIAEIDEKTAKELISRSDDIVFEPMAHLREHSIEVIVPFVQVLFPKAKILPAIVGSDNIRLCENFGKILADVIKNKNALVIASSDLSHYPEYEDAVKVDKKTLEAMISLDPQFFRNTLIKQENSNIKNLATCACGRAPVMAAMVCAKSLGANCGRIISYANSGDIPQAGKYRVVGYGAVAFFKSDNCTKKIKAHTDSLSTLSTLSMLSKDSKKRLLAIARKSIENFFAKGKSLDVKNCGPEISQNQGAFVTLKYQGRLRGCIGRMKSDIPLCRVVSQMAVQAAFFDPRFSPLSSGEFDDIEIEISVLTPFKKVDTYKDIRIGTDGVLIKKGWHSAVYLPQVAPDQGWNLDETLSHLCLKAGLSPDAWKKDMEFFTFQAIVFSEKDLSLN